MMFILSKGKDHYLSVLTDLKVVQNIWLKKCRLLIFLHLQRQKISLRTHLDSTWHTYTKSCIF